MNIISKDDKYPKTLVIRNTIGGMIWQIYHVNSDKEADTISSNAASNGFLGITLEDHQPKLKETWPDWRKTATGAVKEAL